MSLWKALGPQQLATKGVKEGVNNRMRETKLVPGVGTSLPPQHSYIRSSLQESILGVETSP